MADDRLPSMNATSALYQTVITRVTMVGSAWQKILNADPRRYYIRFDGVSGGGTGASVFPDGIQTLPVSSTGNANGREVKWRDCPSVCSGAWYAFGTALEVITIVECIYVGD